MPTQTHPLVSPGASPPYQGPITVQSSGTRYAVKSDPTTLSSSSSSESN